MAAKVHANDWKKPSTGAGGGTASRSRTPVFRGGAPSINAVLGQ
jgi:hypothetical protein